MKSNARGGAFMLIALALAIGVLTGCGEARKDATTQGQKVDRGPAEVIAMPDQFRNVAHKCDGHGHRVYSNSTGDSGTASHIVVIDDPSCGGGPR